ncbi:MAG: Fic/DOC family N-terminal domain-containing protein [Actinomycetaceae bacterium]|nr:Fic/DOC family N-terminal domain-containing protein [Actinomycetaceae bacterium]
MSVDPMTPYQDLPPLPPKVDIETAEVLKAVIAAARALEKANTSANLLPNPRILIDAVPLLEAQASNEIENIVTTNDELFRAAHNVDKPTPATREGLRYREAMNLGHALLKERPITTNTAIAICSRITNIEVDVRSSAGTFIGNPATKQRIYTPPEGKNVILGHLAAWEEFLHGEDLLDPLIKLALLHYQFEAIHPFPDGNGRTGRILNVLYLVHEGMLDNPITYLSGYIVQHKAEYYRRLNAVTQDGEWIPWVLFMLRAVQVTSQWTSNLVYSVRGLLEEVVEALSGTGLPRRDTAYMLFEKPYARYRDFEQTLGVSRPTAAKYANKLEAMGVLEKMTVGREVLFVNRRYLDLLFNTDLPK